MNIFFWKKSPRTLPPPLSKQQSSWWEVANCIISCDVYLNPKGGFISYVKKILFKNDWTLLLYYSLILESPKQKQKWFNENDWQEWFIFILLKDISFHKVMILLSLKHDPFPYPSLNHIPLGCHKNQTILHGS